MDTLVQCGSVNPPIDVALCSYPEPAACEILGLFPVIDAELALEVILRKSVRVAHFSQSPRSLLGIQEDNFAAGLGCHL